MDPRKKKRIIIIIVVILGLLMVASFMKRSEFLRNFIQDRITARRVAESVDVADPNVTLNPGQNSIVMQHDGLTRTSLVFVPSNYNASVPTPVVFGFHGGYGQSDSHDKVSNMNAVAESEGFILVAPDGMRMHWNDGRVGNETEADDVSFVDALIEAVGSKLNVDRSRLYATGISNGGMMSYRLACERTTVFAAIAPVASGFSKDLHAVCKPEGQIPVMLIQGTEDPLIPFDGGEIRGTFGGVLPTLEAVDYWVKHNGVSTTATEEKLPNTDPNDGTETTVYTYGEGTAGEVKLYSVAGGGHTWPAGNQYLPERRVGKLSHDFNGSKAVWDFFKQHSR